MESAHGTLDSRLPFIGFSHREMHKRCLEGALVKDRTINACQSTHSCFPRVVLPIFNPVGC